MIIAAGVAVLDQVTKTAALVWLPGRPVTLLGGGIRLTLTRNPGSAFGLLVPFWMAIVLTLVVLVAMAWYVYRQRASLPPGRAPALGLVLGGAVGNLADRLRFGSVTDFIDLRVWPVFNLADIAITAGVALLAWQVVRRR